MIKDELKDLTEEQKEKIVDEVNSQSEESNVDEKGNTSIFTMNDITEGPSDGSAQAQYEKSISMNAQSLYVLHNILNNGSNSNMHISRKNLIKLLFATLKLPEEGAVLKFGGTEEQQTVCEFAYAQMQMAANCRAFVLGVNAMREARRIEKAKAQESEKLKEDKGEINE